MYSTNRLQTGATPQNQWSLGTSCNLPAEGEHQCHIEAPPNTTMFYPKEYGDPTRSPFKWKIDKPKKKRRMWKFFCQLYLVFKFKVGFSAGFSATEFLLEEFPTST
jgi:hypothetical protein